MPTYEHKCQDTDCQHEWEDEYSIKQDPPKACPKCLKETAKRLISGGSGRGSVELYGQELVDKLKQDVKQLKSDMHKSDKVYSNLLGDANYENLQRKMDARKKR